MKRKNETFDMLDELTRLASVMLEVKKMLFDDNSRIANFAVENRLKLEALEKHLGVEIVRKEAEWIVKKKRGDKK